MDNPHIFISYSRQDSFFIQYFTEQLKSNFTNEDEFSIWLDQLDIGAGEQWKPSIDFGLDNSYAIMVICSPDSMASHQVTYEWSYGIARGKTIIPVLYKVSVEQIHERLREYNIFPAYTPRSIPFPQLIQALRKSKSNFQNDSRIDAGFYNIEAIRKSLKSHNLKEIANALHVAQVAGDKSFVDDIVDLIDIETNELGIRIALLHNQIFEVLFTIAPQRAIDEIIKDFSHRSHHRRKLALAHASKYSQRRSETWVKRLLDEMMNDEMVLYVSGIPMSRIYAIEILADHYHTIFQVTHRDSSYFRYGNHLVRLLGNENIDIIASALRALGNILFTVARSNIEKFLGDSREGYMSEDEEGNIIRLPLAEIADKTLSQIGDSRQPEWAEPQRTDIFDEL